MSGKVQMPPGYRLAAFESLDSTNEEAKRQALSGADEGLVLWARRQTAGRGRRGRAWISPQGGLYFSLLLRPACPADQAAQLSFLSAIAVGEGVLPCLPDPQALAFKWPNDLLIADKKLCGILLESSGTSKGVSWLVVGIGINVATHPEDAAFPATSLHGAGATDAQPEALLGEIVRSFDNWLNRWRNEGFEPILKAWLARAKGLDQEIEVRLADRSLRGIFTALSPDGALILDVPGEGERIIPAGDVYFPQAD